MKKFRFHLLSLVHLPVSEKYHSCAFTQKNVKFAKMMLSLGHEVFVYGAEGSDVQCTKFFETHSLADIRKQFGEGDDNFEIGYDFTKKDGFKFDSKKKSGIIVKMYENAVQIINSHKKEDDFIVATMGDYHKPITDRVKLFLTIENGVAYANSYAKFRAFESYSAMHYAYAEDELRRNISRRGSFYDRVIPNFFEKEKHPFQPKKEDYFLYLGRIIPAKGINIAIETTKAIGAKLIIAGQGRLETTEKHVEFVGYADPEKRAKLMAGAKGFFYPTIYIEPFGGAAVEAMLAGTPIITTDFGVFPEYNINGVTGYRCNRFEEFVEAAKKVHLLDPYEIRKRAERYLTENIRFEYQNWLEDVYSVYEMATNKKSLSWFSLPQK